MFKKLMFIGLFSAAVVANGQNLSLGPTAGFGHSWMSDVNGDVAFHPAYNVGAKLVYSFISNWGVGAELKFSGEGVRTEMSGTTSITRANYIRIPLQGMYFFGDYGNAVRPKLVLGPTLGFLAGGTNRTDQNGNTLNEGKVKDVLNGFDLALTAAAGINFRLRRNVWLNTDISYQHGLTDASKSESNSIMHRGIGLNIGITFPLGTVEQ